MALREWLPLILHYAQPWLSARDIKVGERWAVEIGGELEASDFGIIVLTAENQAAPWILFEAGALSKAFSTGGVAPYLVGLDVKDVAGPLSQFQATKCDKMSTFALLKTINARAAQPIEPYRLQQLFDALWHQLEATLVSLPSPQSVPLPRDEGQVLEDLVATVRRIETRLERMADTDTIKVGSTQAEALTARRGTAAVNVTVHVAGKFPGVGKDIRSFAFTPISDLIAEIATRIGLGIDEYGKTWHLTSFGSRQALKLESGVGLLERAHGPISVVVREGPA